MAKNDYETNVAAKKEIELLMSISQPQLEILRELRGLKASGLESQAGR